MSNEVLNKSIQSAWLNILMSIWIRLFTFIFDAVFLRYVTQEYLGIGVRTALLTGTLLFISREPFRRACLTKPENEDWKGIINLVWLSIPISSAASLVLGYIWIYVLEPPESYLDQYVFSIKMNCLSILLVLCTEPFYIIGQAYMHVKFRTIVDLSWATLGHFLMVGVAVYDPENGIYLSAYGMLFNSIVFLLLHYAYFNYVLTNQDVSTTPKECFIPFKSMAEFLPNLRRFRIDLERWTLSVSFFKQGFLKQMLTEGEKYMFTWFSLMTLSEQGVYDRIANLGSIPARLFFAKMEESAHLYFSQTITRGSNADMKKEEAPSRNLHYLLKGLILLGVVICVFGVPFCHMLLSIYGGTLLSSGIGPALLRTHCFYILFLAVNGISECYAFNVMTSEEVSNYNYIMTVMTFIFLACTWVFAKLFGPIGFTLANCCNFTMRIVYNFRVIDDRHRSPEVTNPLKELLPNSTTVLTLVLSGIICLGSEYYVYDVDLKSSFNHLVIGGFTFLSAMGVIGFKEPMVKEGILKLKKKYFP